MTEIPTAATAMTATTTVAEPVLKVADLDVSFPSEEGRVTAVRGLSYSVDAGEILAIVGESGSGKSVSSLAVMGLLPDTARVRGSIQLQGQELLGLSDVEMSKFRGSRVSMVFQDPLTALTPVYSVGDQVAEALRVHQPSLSKSEIDARVLELFDLVGIPDAEKRVKQYPHEFSGGMRQRVVIAIAIANDPDLIIADEPTTALDVTIQAQVLDLLRKARDITGAAVVIITHDLGVVAGIADRAIVMYAGRAVESAPVEELFDHPSMPYTSGLLGAIPKLDAPERQRLVPIPGNPPALINLAPGCPFAPRCPAVIDECREAEPELLEVAPGHLTACIRSEEVAKIPSEKLYGVGALPEGEGEVFAKRVDERPVVLEVEDLHKRYPIMKGSVLRRKVGEFEAVKGVSFTLHEGETLAIVGESGCGKSTTLMEILGFRRPSGGTVRVFGQEAYTLSKPEQRKLRRDMQVVFQDPMGSLDPRMPVGELIAEPLKVHGMGRDERNARVRELMDLVGMRASYADRFPAAFSGGQRQRIGIARALALNPKVLILDEPVSALDVSIQAGVLNLLWDLQSELGLAYLFVSHDLSVVRHLADRVAVMRQGAFVEAGDVAEIFDNPQHPYTKALLTAIPIPDPRKQRERVTLAAQAAAAIE